MGFEFLAKPVVKYLGGTLLLVLLFVGFYAKGRSDGWALSEARVAVATAEMQAKDEADVLLLVINAHTRGVATVGEVAYYMGLGRQLALVVNDIPPGATLYDQPLTQPEIDDLNRGRIFLRKAGTNILAICIILWWLGAFPRVAEPREAAALRAQAALSSNLEEIHRLNAEADHLARHQHHLDSKDVVGGEAVLQAMHASGVFSHIAADGAGDLAGRIRCIEEPVSRRRLADGEVADTALQARGTGHRIDLKDPVEAREGQKDRITMRQGPTRKASSGSPGHHRHAKGMTGPEHRRDLALVTRQRDQKRRLLFEIQAVALVRRNGFLGIEHAVG